MRYGRRAVMPPGGPVARRALLGLAATVPMAAAQAPWRPDRPVRLITGFAPGGTIDLVARLTAPAMGGVLGQRVLVENQTGASGNLVTQAVLRAPPDGQVLGIAGLQLVTNPALMATPGYDPERDVQMVGQFNAMPVLVLASATSSLSSLAALIEKARRQPVTIGTAGFGTSSHLGAALLFRHVGGSFTPVPYRGGAPAFQGLLAGDVEAMFDLAGGYHAAAAAQGRIRILAVMQERRIAPLPEVPAFGELGLPAEAGMRSWTGVFVRAGTPRPILAALHQAVTAAGQADPVQQRFRDLAMEPVTSPEPEAFQRFYVRELRRWSTLIAASGMAAG